MEAQDAYSGIIEGGIEQPDIDGHHDEHATSHIESQIFVARNAEHECGHDSSVNKWHYFFDPFFVFLPPLRGLDLRF